MFKKISFVFMHVENSYRVPAMVSGFCIRLTNMFIQGDSGHRAEISALGDIPRNRSTGDFGVSASGEPSHYDGLTQKIPSSLAMTMGMASKIPGQYSMHDVLQ